MESNSKANDKSSISPNPVSPIPPQSSSSSFSLLENVQLRLLLFGVVSTAISYYLYTWAVHLYFKTSSRPIWPAEYGLFPNSEEIWDSIELLPFEKHMDLLFMLLIGTVNIFFYVMFFIDLLSEILPEAIVILDVYPILIGMVDFLENFFLFLVIVNLPDKNMLAEILGYLTLVKNVLTYIMLAITTICLITLPCRKLFQDSRNRKDIQNIQK